MSDPVALLVNALGPGGAERVVLTICAELIRRGREVELVCLEREVAYELPPGLRVRFLAEGGPKPPASRAPRKGGLAKLLALPGQARLLAALSRARGYRTVQSHLFRANYVNVLSRAFGARHEIEVVNHTKPERLLSEGIAGRANAVLARHLYPRADRLVAISLRMASDLAAFIRVPEPRIATINNPYEVDRVRELAALPSDCPHEARAGRRTIAAMGRLVPLKRFGDLIEAFAFVAASRSDLDLVVLGEGPGRGPLEALATGLGISDRVFFPGFAVNPYRLLGASSAFVLASETEGFPNALVEALALGIPVISTDCVSGPREILAPGTDWRKGLSRGEGVEEAAFGLLVPVGDPVALAEGLSRILDECALAGRLAAAGPGRADEFAARRIVDKYENLLFPEEA
jgi:glycosyltransferase involved in cell wall biosynthesis